MREGLIAVAALAVVMLGGKLVLHRSRGARAVPGRAPRSGGPIVIRPPRRTAVMFGISALFPAGLIGALTLRSWSAGASALGALVGVAATLAVLAFAAYQFAYASRARLVVHDTGIERIGVSRRRLVGWGSVAKLAYNPAHHWFFITVSDGSHLWLPADVTGAAEFARVAVRRLPPAVLQANAMAREVLDELATARGDDAPRDAG